METPDNIYSGKVAKFYHCGLNAVYVRNNRHHRAQVQAVFHGCILLSVWMIVVALGFLRNNSLASIFV